MIIRRMTLADVPAVEAIEAATFLTPWPEGAFVQELNAPSARYLVAEEDGEIIGFGGARWLMDEGHITNICVAQAHRGCGVGRALTQAVMQYMANLGADYVILEVRRSNAAAQSLYMSLGFIKLGVRKRYYDDTGEDALILVCTQMPPADPDFEEEDTVHE